MRALTGLNPEEFQALAKTFSEVWAEHTRLNWQGQPRQRAAGAGGKAELATPEQKLFLDGTDRPIRRPQDPEKQKQCYSGRKKRHLIKNLILTQERTIQYLSPTAPGRQSDKRLADPLAGLRLPKSSVLIADLGFQGLEVRGAQLAQAVKKPKGRPLSPAFQVFNRIITRARVPVEHVISGIKRCRIVNDTFRHLKAGLDDLVMEAACGLHNFREAYRRDRRPALLPIQMN